MAPRGPVVTAISVESLPGEVYQVVLHRMQDGKVISSERMHQSHVWGVVKDDFLQDSIDHVFPKGLE